MALWPSSRAGRVTALLRIGWSVKRQSGSHRTLQRTGWPDVVFAFHDSEEIAPRMLARIAKDWPDAKRFVMRLEPQATLPNGSHACFGTS